MGLDISVYQSVKLVKAMTVKEWSAGSCDEYGEDSHAMLFLDHECHRGRIDGMAEGVYEVDVADIDISNSYSGYNRWREGLAALVGTTPREVWNGGPESDSVPFYELIDFSDCEGFIGPKTSAKLAKDFDDWAERAATHLDSYWRQTYELWRKAFKAAAGNGAVQFH